MSPWFRRPFVAVSFGVVCLAIGTGGARAQPDSEEERLKAVFRKAVVLKDQGEFEAALPLSEEALVLAPRVYGPDHPNVAAVLYHLAGLYKSLGRYADAEPLYKRGLKIHEAKL